MSWRPPRIVSYRGDGDTPLTARVWEADGPTGQILFLHGITSHGGWYARTCSRLAEAGWSVHFPDRRGSGLNQTARGEVRSYRTWIRDVECYGRNLRADLDTILTGISWGGKLAVAVAQARNLPLSGLALVCPGLYARQYPGTLKQWLVRTACHVGLGACRVPIPLQDPRLFAEDPEHRQYVARDPLALRHLALRTVAADFELTRHVRACRDQVPHPVLLLLAGQDPIVDNQRVRQFVERCGSGSRQVIEYPRACHTLEFDAAAEAYAADLAGWARKVAPESARVAAPEHGPRSHSS